MPTTAMMIDALIAMRNGQDGVSPEHFWQLVERFRADLVNQALAILGVQADAEDVAQDSLCQAFQDLSKLRDPAALGHWLRSINRHNALRLARQRRHLAHREMRLPTGAQPAAPIAPGSETLGIERLAQAIDRLPEEYRIVVVYRYWEHLSYDEIAARLGLPVGTVNSRMARAYNLLSAKLRPNPTTGAGAESNPLPFPETCRSC